MSVIDQISPVLDDIGTDNDEPNLAHIIMKRDYFAGFVEGQKIKALCGYEWVPTRDPDRYPVCTACIAAKDQQQAASR